MADQARADSTLKEAGQQLKELKRLRAAAPDGGASSLKKAEGAVYFGGPALASAALASAVSAISSARTSSP